MRLPASVFGAANILPRQSQVRVIRARASGRIYRRYQFWAVPLRFAICHLFTLYGD